MNINILIPSKGKPSQLRDNIKKNKFPKFIHKIIYLILVDSIEEKKIYEKYLSRFENVFIYHKKFYYQSDRYIYLLKIFQADFYLIGSDDIIINSSSNTYKINEDILLLYCNNENKYIINHPIISRNIKENIIDIFKIFKFKILCIDTVISFAIIRSQIQQINLDIIHFKNTKIINKQLFKYYAIDLLVFLKYSFNNFFRVKDYKKNISIMFSIFIDFLSAIKNYYLTKN